MTSAAIYARMSTEKQSAASARPRGRPVSLAVIVVVFYGLVLGAERFAASEAARMGKDLPSAALDRGEGS